MQGTRFGHSLGSRCRGKQCALYIPPVFLALHSFLVLPCLAGLPKGRPVRSAILVVYSVALIMAGDMFVYHLLSFFFSFMEKATLLLLISRFEMPLKNHDCGQLFP